MDKFNKIYLNMLYESSGKLPFDLEKYIHFLGSAVKFDKNDNIIAEDKELLIDVPEECINYLIENKNTLIKSDNFKSLFEESKHWRNLKNIEFKNIFFALFDFDNDESIDKFHYNCFKIESEYIENVREQFKQKCSALNGFFGEYSNLDVICINTQSNNIFQTIYHELSHFIQVKGNIRIINGLTKNQVKNKNLLKILFNVDYEQVFNYFSDKEFIPHVDDLINDLFKTKKKFYNEISNFEFLEELRKFLMVKNRPEMITNKFFNNFKDANNGDYATLAMLLFAYICKFRFQQIFNIIKRRFK